MALDRKRSGWRPVILTFAVVFALSILYAVMRYNIFGTVGAEQIPLYIANKAIALTAAILIGISFIIGPLARFWPKRFVPKLPLRKHFGVFGFGLAAFHVLLSLIIFDPAYFPRFFAAGAAGGKLTFEAELSMLVGALAIFIFSAVSITSLPSVEREMKPKQWLFIQRLGYIAFALVALHVLVMGYRGWLNSAGWPSGLLPISLISFVAIAFVLATRLAALVLSKRR